MLEGTPSYPENSIVICSHERLAESAVHTLLYLDGVKRRNHEPSVHAADLGDERRGEEAQQRRHQQPAVRDVVHQELQKNERGAGGDMISRGRRSNA